MNRAITIAREIIEDTYTGVCTIVEYQQVKDPLTKTTNFQEVPVIGLEDIPCKLSYKTIAAANQNDNTHYSATQITKLFISPDIVVKEGSKLTITQNEVTKDYQYSGIPAIYPTHQELILKDFKGRV